jgi:hypothetical protein
MQNADMAKDAAVTVRIPTDLKRRLEARARRNRRSLSAEVASELEAACAREPAAPTTHPVRFAGMFKGARVPTAEDFRHVRALLWGRLPRPERRR